MTGTHFPGVTYAAAAVGGFSRSGAEIPECPAGCLHPDGKVIDGVFRVVCQGHNDGAAWLWNGLSWMPLTDPLETYGVCVGKFDDNGRVFVSCVGEKNVRIYDARSGGFLGSFHQDLGVEGIALVDARGVHGRKDWYGAHGCGFYVLYADGVLVGQGAQGGLVAQLPNGPLKLLEAGSWTFTQFDRQGGDFSVSAAREAEADAQVRWFSVVDIDAAPDYNPTPEPEPPDPEPEPEPEPEPPQPEPEPEPEPPQPEEPIMIAYGQPMFAFSPGQFEDHPDGDGLKAVRLWDGTVLCCTPEGHLETRPSAGAWESFRVSASGTSLIAERDGGKVYVLPLVEW